jgi:hypothetical protein
MNMWLYQPEEPKPAREPEREAGGVSPPEPPAAGSPAGAGMVHSAQMEPYTGPPAVPGECPHCGRAQRGPEHPEIMGTCPVCWRAFGGCPRCGGFVRLNDYWRRPGPLPPLPPERAACSKMQFVVEDAPGGGELAVFREAGHMVVLQQNGRALTWMHCPGGAG